MTEPTTVDASSKAFAKAAVRLLKEYTESLKDLSRQASQAADEGQQLRTLAPKPGDPRQLRLQSRYNSILEIFNKIHPAAADLARVVSARIEHGKMDELDRAELRLRLAEFEGNLTAAQQVINSSRP